MMSQRSRGSQKLGAGLVSGFTVLASSRRSLDITGGILSYSQGKKRDVTERKNNQVEKDKGEKKIKSSYKTTYIQD